MLDRILAIGMLVFIGGAMWAWHTNPAYYHEPVGKFREWLSALLEFAGMLGIGYLVYTWTDNHLLCIGTFMGLFILRLCLPTS